MESSFSDLSKQLTKTLTLNIKRQQGIYFTPSNTVKQLIDITFRFNQNIKTILEPSCGSGQFLDQLVGKNVTAIEQNKTIFDQVSVKHQNIIHGNFLTYPFKENSFDCIIGNPPYFVVPKASVDKVYHKYFTGRPNIYVPFILKSFELLNYNGILAFVLPSNFLNCVYYNKLRKYLSNFNIVHIEIINTKFMETEQPVCLFVIEKANNRTGNAFIHYFGDIIIFKPENDINQIKKLCENTTTLAQLKCTMNVGTVVWNQCKNQLSDDNSLTRLIYCGDFKNNCLELGIHKDPTKKHYINKKGSNETVLLVNRGYGTGKYHLNYCIVENIEYLVENHCMVISSNDPEKKKLFERIIKSFENPKTQRFIDLVFSNNAINIEEFTHILPIYLY